MAMMSNRYLRPVLRANGARSQNALKLGGGWLWFEQLEVINRSGSRDIISTTELSDGERTALCAPRSNVAGLDMTQPQIMGILNVTPDSFSDGGDFDTDEAARQKAALMAQQGAAIIDIGGESTRPGAQYVNTDQELQRTVALTQSIAADHSVSIDTRKAEVARRNLAAGAVMFNDISALSFDPESMTVAKQSNAPVCLMHSLDDPSTMQNNPQYDHVVLDIYDYLAQRIKQCVAAGIDRRKIIIDPGIGFGKTYKHNIEIVRNLALFHTLGCPILFGASRKRMIDTAANVPDPKDRLAGSIALALCAVAQGAQIIRVHDVAQTKQAITMWHATQIEQAEKSNA